VIDVCERVKIWSHRHDEQSRRGSEENYYSRYAFFSARKENEKFLVITSKELNLILTFNKYVIVSYTYLFLKSRVSNKVRKRGEGNFIESGNTQNIEMEYKR